MTSIEQIARLAVIPVAMGVFLVGVSLSSDLKLRRSDQQAVKISLSFDAARTAKAN